MSPKSLLNIILKIIGLFVIKDVLVLLPQLLSSIFYLSKPGVADDAAWGLGMTILILFIYGLFSYYLVFKSGLIIEKLKLEKGFDEDTIAFNIHRSTILSIAIIVIGGLIIADEIPNLCRQLFMYFQEKRMTYGQTDPTLSFTVLSVAKIIIGFLLISYQKLIVNYIELKRKS
jgi:hypothetical protein